MVDINEVSGFNSMWDNMIDTYNSNFHAAKKDIYAVGKIAKSNTKAVKILEKQLRKSRFRTNLAFGSVVLLAFAVNELREKVQELNKKVEKIELEKAEDDMK